jgi:hypothetical protein
MTKNLYILIIILLSAISLVLYFQNPKKINNNQQLIEQMQFKIDSLESLSKKNDTIYITKVKKVVEVIESRPNTKNADTLTKYIDTLTMSAMESIQAADVLIDNLKEININQKEIIKLQEDDYAELIQEYDKLKNENKLLKITSVVGLTAVTLLIIIL